MSKYKAPSMYVCSVFVKSDIGWPLQTTISASLPILRLPTLSSIWSNFAGFKVTNFHASSSEISPYFTAFAASKFNLLESSELSEFNATVTPALCIIDALYGIASFTSYL